jgi:hypothetical protein
MLFTDQLQRIFRVDCNAEIITFLRFPKDWRRNDRGRVDGTYESHIETSLNTAGVPADTSRL